MAACLSLKQLQPHGCMLVLETFTATWLHSSSSNTRFCLGGAKQNRPFTRVLISRWTTPDTPCNDRSQTLVTACWRRLLLYPSAREPKEQVVTGSTLGQWTRTAALITRLRSLLWVWVTEIIKYTCMSPVRGFPCLSAYKNQPSPERRRQSSRAV